MAEIFVNSTAKRSEKWQMQTKLKQTNLVEWQGETMHEWVYGNLVNEWTRARLFYDGVK